MLPALTPATAFFWTSGADGVLRLLRCDTCGRFLHPPGPMCRDCLGRELRVTDVSGRAVVYSFTVNHQPWRPDLAEPYVVALVELVEQVGLRLLTRIVGCDPDAVTIGMAVEVVFEEDQDVWLPFFGPAG